VTSTCPIPICCYLIEKISAFNRTQANGSYMSHEKGSFFYRGVSPSKIGLRAPYLDTMRLRSRARVFLSRYFMSWVLCIAITDSGIRSYLLKYGHKQLEAPGVEKRLTQRSFFSNILSATHTQDLTGFQLLPQYWGWISGSFFCSGVSPSKIGPIAPY
jgi:hypothetical protein